MVWGIIGALDVEVELIKNRLDLEKTEKHFGATYYVGSIGEEKVVVVQCGIGKINAAVCAYTMISQFQVDCVVNVGIAGALAPELKVLDVVVGTELVFHDLDPTVYKKYYPYETVFKCDETLINRCIKAIDALPEKVTHYAGRIATGDEFVESSELKKNIVANFAPHCVEMEGAAIAQVAYMNEIPFLVIRTMSDSADDNAKESYDNLFDTAAQVSANIILTMIAGK